MTDITAALDELEAKARAATQPSPWATHESDTGETCVLDAHGMLVAEVGHAPLDGEFIAAASPAVIISLISRLRAAETALAVALEWREIDKEVEAYMAGYAPTSTWNREREAYANLRTALDSYRAKVQR